MGAWGQGNFENDHADDWVYGLILGNDLTPVYAALAKVREQENSYLDNPMCYEALAAVEVISALRGYPSRDLPDRLTTWIASHPQQVSDDLVKEAMIVVVRIFRDSELRDVSENMGHIPMEWYRVIGDLMSRLK